MVEINVGLLTTFESSQAVPPDMNFEAWRNTVLIQLSEASG